MSKTDTLHIRVNEDVKKSAEGVLEVLGLTLSEAVNIFLHQVNLNGGLPFDVRLPAPDRVTVSSKADLYCKLDEAENDIKQNKTSTAEEAFGRMREKYGV